MKRIRLVAWLLTAAVVAPLAAAAPPPSPDGLDNVVQPFFARHCVACHGGKKQEGDLRLDLLVVNFDSPKIMGHWEEIMNRINSGDMPPEEEPRPGPADIARVADWISGQLREADAARQSSGAEKVSFRKLSREEYANTIRDLLGVTFDATDPTGLTEDPDWHGFQRIGSVLTLSPDHVERYLAAADLVLGEALSLGPQPKREVTRWTVFDIGRRKRQEKEYRQRGMLDKARLDLAPNTGQLRRCDLDIRTAGQYLLRVKLSGLRPAGGRAPRLRLNVDVLNRTLLEQDVEAPEDEPVTLEARVHLPVGKHQVRIINAVPGPNPQDRRSQSGDTPLVFTGLESRLPWQMKFTDDDGEPLVPFILLDFMELEGPILESWPTPAHQQIFFGGKQAAKDLDYARQIIARFAERAYRRPAGPAEVERLVKLVERSQKLGDRFEQAVKTALVAVLCSKSFLYLEEGSPNSASATLSDWELASRLSYFLWSSMPDQRLLDLARSGKLHEPAILRGEVCRMLASPKSAEFAETFPYQWLQLRKVGMFAPDQALYPEYDDYLEKSMIAESIGFFREVLTRNASLREFLDSDWTLLNERLAAHYGISGVQGEAMRRVSLTPDDHRGGLLTQGAILSLTSDGTRHRPVHRGVWVLESVIGKPPPPPPPPANVPALGTPTANARKMTVREKLEQHRSDANCAACHRKIDPLGLAFDNYDAIGRWRTVETVRDGIGTDPALDASGELYDGRKFADPAGLKRLLLEDIDKFAVAFSEKLATFALRRGMTFADRAELKQIAERSKANDYKLASLIEMLVTSKLFLKR